MINSGAPQKILGFVSCKATITASMISSFAFHEPLDLLTLSLDSPAQGKMVVTGHKVNLLATAETSEVADILRLI